MTRQRSARSGFFILCAGLFMVFAMAGCKRPAFPNCSKDADCRLTVDGKETSGVCHMGKCEECVEDADCSGVQQCVSNRCQTSCQANTDCKEGSHCENSYCVNDCLSDASCKAGEACTQGRCVAQASGGEGALSAGAEGCGSTLRRIYFGFDKYDIRDEDQGVLDELAACLKNNPDKRATIAGHTDPRGTPAYNLLLGQKRADAVRQGLNQKGGVPNSQMKTVSYGEKNPLMKGSDETAWSKNRRSEISLH